MIISAFIFGIAMVFVGTLFALGFSLIAIAIGVPWTPAALIVCSILGMIASVAFFRFLGWWFFGRKIRH